MDHNWPYVAAGYGLTAAVVGGYALWMHTRFRRVRRSVDESSAGPDAA